MAPDRSGGFSTGTDWYVGRPLIVTENDYGLDLYNGDTGVVIEGPKPGVWSPPSSARGAIAEVSPTRLAAVDTVYAMTVHKSQGSQYGAVAFMLPSPDSRILTRELLYTAVTRARERLILVGSESSDPRRHRPADHPGLGARPGAVGRNELSRSDGRPRRPAPSPHARILLSRLPRLGKLPGLTLITALTQLEFRVLSHDGLT